VRARNGLHSFSADAFGDSRLTNSAFSSRQPRLESRIGAVVPHILAISFQACLHGLVIFVNCKLYCMVKNAAGIRTKFLTLCGRVKKPSALPVWALANKNSSPRNEHGQYMPTNPIERLKGFSLVWLGSTSTPVVEATFALQLSVPPVQGTLLVPMR